MNELDEIYKIGITPILENDGYVYKYANEETAVKILENESLFFQTPEKFNDPFDLYERFYKVTPTKNELYNWLSKQNIISEKTEKIIERFDKNSDYFKELIEMSISNYRKKFGISCFSGGYKNVLMWSHYADKHKGICIGFNLKTNIIYNTNIVLLKVRYIKELEQINFFDKGKLSTFLWLFTKAEDWHYENEIRAVALEKNGLIQYDKSLLKEVYFGVNSSSEFIEKVETILKAKKIQLERIVKMKYSLNNYGIEDN